MTPFILILALFANLETIRGDRTILTRPAGTTARLPAIMLVPWLSCDSVDFQDGPLDGMNELSRRIATRSGLVMLRVDKPAPCADLDFQTELAAYRAALASLRANAWVDPDRIILIGMSNGGGILPLVSGDKPVAGYIIVNGWSSTWYEHMLDHLRRGAEASGVAAGEVSTRMQANAELYADYLIARKTPGEVIKAKPYLAKYWDDEPARQYGRPAAFFQQLQQLNLAAAWSKVASPTLVVWGEADTIMSREDHERIVRLVNANKRGAARLIVVPKMTHFVDVDGKFPDSLFVDLDNWLAVVTRR